MRHCRKHTKCHFNHEFKWNLLYHFSFIGLFPCLSNVTSGQNYHINAALTICNTYYIFLGHFRKLACQIVSVACKWPRPENTRSCQIRRGTVPISLGITKADRPHRYMFLSRFTRKPTFCICEIKDADQLRGNREADQRLCFRYIDSTIPLLSKSEISSLWPSSVAVQPGLCRTRSEARTLVFSRRSSFASKLVDLIHMYLVVLSYFLCNHPDMTSAVYRGR